MCFDPDANQIEQREERTDMNERTDSVPDSTVAPTEEPVAA